MLPSCSSFILQHLSRLEYLLKDQKKTIALVSAMSDILAFNDVVLRQSQNKLIFIA